MLKNLFSSKVRIRILNIFLLNPDSEFYLRELSTKFNISPRHVSLELQNLSKDFTKMFDALDESKRVYSKPDPEEITKKEVPHKEIAIETKEVTAPLDEKKEGKRIWWPLGLMKR